MRQGEPICAARAGRSTCSGPIPRVFMLGTVTGFVSVEGIFFFFLARVEVQNNVFIFLLHSELNM